MTTTDSTSSLTNPFRPAPMTPDEVEKVAQIKEVACCSEVDALKHLRRKNGNVEQAIDAIFSGQLADDGPTTSTEGNLLALRASVAGVVGPVPKSGKSSPPMIDLTADEDEDMNKAMRMSLEDQGAGGESRFVAAGDSKLFATGDSKFFATGDSKFFATDRAPNPEWAVVPSNKEVRQDVVSQDDQQMSQAIEASLHFEMSQDGYEEISLEERVRKGDSPVALRPTLPTLAYAGLLLQALFFVPQVRDSVARYRPQPSDVSEDGIPIFTPPTSGPEWTLWSLLELFVNMDLARMSELNVDKCMNAFEALPWNMNIDRPGDLSTDFYHKLAWNLEALLYVPLARDPEGFEWPRLFYFRYNYADVEPVPSALDERLDMCVVKVDVRGTPGYNDLLSCLSSELFPERHQRPQAIFDASEVVAFQLVRSHVPSGDREIFAFPPYLYLDQFLKENADLAGTKRRLQWDLAAEVESLSQRRLELTHHEGRDVLADLHSSIHYYENVAEAEDDDRKSLIEDTLSRLRTVLTKVETEIKEIEETIVKHRAQAATAFDCPELQRHRYDLRAVIVHDGFNGRSHLYSYVKHKGAWWKTVDYMVTEVPEEMVLNDSAGLHLSAGPYFLIYSAALTEEEENIPMPWPEYLKDSVKHNNIAFVSALPEEIRATVVDPNSPPITPYVLPSPADEEITTMETEPLVPSAEMDID